MKGSKGKMQGTRRKLKKDGGVAPNQHLKEFEVGEKVQIDIEPSSHSTMPDPKFQGRVVEVTGTEGGTYLVKLKDGEKKKKIKVKPVHLKKIKSQD
ncbi:MAG: 50S ribosomal protein L21e [Candidatus Aenigmatarchaeota archaeon]